LHFFADFRDENYNRNTTKRKTITFVKRESNLFNANREKKNTILRQNWRRLHWPALACTFTDSAGTFSFKIEPNFPNSSLNLDFQDSENETPNKRIMKMADEEYGSRAI